MSLIAVHVRRSILALTSWAGAAAAATPTADTIDLFTAGDGGYSVYRIPALVVSTQGTVLAACEARLTGRSDWDQIDILLRRSTDGGVTWDAPRQVAGQKNLPAGLQRNSAAVASGHGKTNGFTFNNPTWIADPITGATHLFYCAEYARAFVITTRDGGATFTSPQEITPAFDTFRTRDKYHWRVLAIGPGHGVALASGRLVAAVWLSTSESENAHRPSVSATVYSDDHGETWHAGNIMAHNTAELPNPSETAITEVAPGRILASVRSETSENRRAFVWSSDGATNWTQPDFHPDLPEPVCMAALHRQTTDPAGRQVRLLYTSPDPKDLSPRNPGGVGLRRENLTLRISNDNGVTWNPRVVLESGPSAYSDLATLADGTILCLYEAGMKNPYQRLTFVRLPADPE